MSPVRYGEVHPDVDAPIFVVSAAADLAGLHAQTLRQYDRIGLVVPSRTRGGGRRYSARDVALLREVQRLSQEGVSLTGIARILELEREVDSLTSRVGELTETVHRLEARAGSPVSRVFSVSSTGETYAAKPGERPRATRGNAVIVWGSSGR